MYVQDIIDEFGFKLLAGENGLSREVNGLYCCDLLSWVMSHANKNDVWITVQTHVNVVAVASLIDISCIIIPESIKADEETIIKADEEGIPILSTDLKSFDIFKKFYEFGMR